MGTNLNAGRIGLRQAEPPEGRFGFPLGPAFGGGDGLNFVTGAEEFDFNSNNIQGTVKPSSIQSMWIDASALTAGVSVTIVTPTQTFIVAKGTQGYLIVTSQVPFTLKVTADVTTRGLVKIILYNYNVFFTGNFATGAAQGGGTSGTGSTGGGAGGGSTGGSGGTGGGKGGFF